ncbi:GSCOCG00008073001-RA-CDS [Cotesia congregata]|nr:GSCOCG00008073001-RA-CDS [Cotesia congregata]
MKKLLTICSIWIIFTGEVNLLSIPIVSDIQDIIGLVTDISDIATGRHDLTAGNLFKKKVDPTLVAVNQLSDQLSELTETINLKMDNIMTAVVQDVPRALQLTNLIRKLIEITSRIDELYVDYLFYVKKSESLNEYTIDEFGRVVTSHKFGDIPDLLSQLYHLFIPGPLDQKDQSILDVMISSFKAIKEEDRCNQLKSPQQHIYDIYETIIVTEIKGYSMSAWAYGMLAIYHNSSFTIEIDRATYLTMQRCSKYVSAVYNALELITRDLYLCDPPEHIKGETHVQINSITRIITHEDMMFSSCDDDCSSIHQSYYRGPHDYKQDLLKTYWNPNQPCLGLMYKCGEERSIDFCELPPGSDKRYSWMSAIGSPTYGYRDSCSDGTKRSIVIYSSWYQCMSCLCECSEDKPNSKAIRTFSLRPQLADIENNMVVTGVKFELKDMMIHVQIEEGKLLRACQIDQSTVRLKELENFKYLEEGDEGKFVKITGDDEEELKHGIDYQFIRFKQRDVNIDNVNSQEPGYVVTGLKMSQDPENDKAIQLDVHITPFDFTTGLLVPTDDQPSKWITHKDMPGHDRPFTERKEQDVTEYDRGDAYTDNRPNSEDFTDIWFVISSKDTDASQSTVPFMDRRLVAASPRVPIDGVSLFHRGRNRLGWVPRVQTAAN